ncbi:hypothetical protein [Aliikangiella sp. G2MR2-5]|uniref:hypothetical protein n=1 Tax=Aliikangiella sp. G2MR2-5 TaxID=2788943 RepID=UPI0018A98FC6|nr:hypothetical protein [Aliikangiella sp. G2MR2-5]
MNSGQLEEKLGQSTNNNSQIFGWVIDGQRVRQTCFFAVTWFNFEGVEDQLSLAVSRQVR